MPGVPPDAVAQVKKGLRGLFNRRKSKEPKPHQGQPAPTSSATSTAAAGAPVAAANNPQGSVNQGSLHPPPPQSASSDITKAPHLSAPSQVEEANAIDLNPAASGAGQQHTKSLTETTAKAATGPSTTLDPSSTKPVTETLTGLNQPSTQPSTKLSTEPSSGTTGLSTKGPTEPSTGVSEPPSKTTTGPPAGPTAPSTGMSATSGPLGDHMAEAYVDDDDNIGPKGETLTESGKIEEGKPI